jgi:O-antigen/teichoic acid export membrane protein
MGGIKSLIGQTAIYGLSSMVGRMLNFLLIPILTQYFLPSEFGINTEFYAYIGFLGILFSYGMETSFFRFNSVPAFKPTLFATLAYSLLFSSIILSIILLAFSHPINLFLHYQSRPTILYYMIGVLFFDSLTIIPFAQLRANNKPFVFVAYRLGAILINVFFTLFFLFVWHGTSPTASIEYVFLANLIASALLFFAFIPSYFKHHTVPDFKILKVILPYSLPFVIIGFAGVINETFDRILLNYLLPNAITAKAEIGIYGACYKLSIILTLFSQAFRMGAEPYFFKSANDASSKEQAAKIMQVFAAFCLLILLGTLLFIDYLKYYIGPLYRSGLSIVPILLMANLCLAIYYQLSIWYKLTNRTILGSYITIIGAAITLISNFILIPWLGYIGAAWATLICYATMMIICYLWGQKYYAIPYNLKSFFKHFSLILIVYGISCLLVKNIYFGWGYIPSVSISGFFILSVLFLCTVWIIWNWNKHLLQGHTSS